MIYFETVVAESKMKSRSVKTSNEDGVLAIRAITSRVVIPESVLGGSGCLDSDLKSTPMTFFESSHDALILTLK